jgi:chemosensory pili system protein ChpA (sensor histidine kinase/response regulator)
MPRPSRQELLPGFVDECRLAIFALRRQLRWLAGSRGSGTARAEEMVRLSHSLAGTAGLLELPALSEMASAQEALWGHYLGESRPPEPSEHKRLEELLTLFAAQVEAVARDGGENEAITVQARELLEVSVEAIGRRSDATHATQPDVFEDLPRDDSGLATELAEVFAEEAVDHLQALEDALRRCAEVGSADPVAVRGALARARRAAHSLKGAAGAVGRNRVAFAAHRLEDLLDHHADHTHADIASALPLWRRGNQLLQDLIVESAGHAAEPEQRAEHSHRAETMRQFRADVDAFLREHAAITGPAPEAAGNEPNGNGNAESVRKTIDESLMTDGLDSERVPDFDAHTSPVAEPPRESAPTAPVESDFVTPSASPRGAETPSRTIEAGRLRVGVKDVDHLLRLQGDWLTNRAAFEQKLDDLARWSRVLDGALDRLRVVSRGLDSGAGASSPIAAEGVARSAHPTTDDEVATARSPEGFDPLEFDQYGSEHVLARDMAESTADVARLAAEVRRIAGDLQGVLQAQTRMAKSGNATLVRLRTRPVHTLFPRLESAARRIAVEQRKEVVCVLEGGNVQLDAELLAALSDSLLHLVRNAVDHGIETPEERKSAGKVAAGTVTLSVETIGSRVRVVVRDDGRGLDRARVLDQAVRRGIVPLDESRRMSPERIDELVFEPGLSTAERVTKFSGRGVGLDVVRAALVERQGTVTVESSPGTGTAVELLMPLTVATTRVLFVTTCERTFALPIATLKRIVRAEAEDFETIAGTRHLRLATPARHGARSATNARRGAHSAHSESTRVPVSRLADLLGIASDREDGGNEGESLAGPVVVMSVNGRDHALLIDRLATTREVVVKSLGSHIKQLPGLSGMTLLGDGTPVPILNPAALLGGEAGRGSERGGIRPVATRTGRGAGRPSEPSPLLVAMADDSVSVRHVLARFLEGRRWRSLQAGDGLQLLERLHAATRLPDAIFLDVEMPRMDGFGTLAELAKDPRLASIPVIMLTSRSGEKHRRRAFELGAAGYLVKPWRDEDLLTALRDALAKGSTVSVGESRPRTGAGAVR